MPSAQDCAAAALKTDVSAKDAPPPAGTYDYTVKGTRTVSGARKPLPARSELIVTRERRIGGLRCFRVQRRLGPALADTATVVARGPDAYTTQLELQAGGSLTTIRPRPPIRSVSGGDPEWSGSFGGDTRGQFQGSVIGRKTMRVGGRKVTVLGVELRVSFAGKVTGTDISDQWVETKHNLPVAGTTKEMRSFGLDKIGLDYGAKVSSLEPRGP